MIFFRFEIYCTRKYSKDTHSRMLGLYYRSWRFRTWRTRHIVWCVLLIARSDGGRLSVQTTRSAWWCTLSDLISYISYRHHLVILLSTWCCWPPWCAMARNWNRGRLCDLLMTRWQWRRRRWPKWTICCLRLHWGVIVWPLLRLICLERRMFISYCSLSRSFVGLLYILEKKSILNAIHDIVN